MRLYYENFGKGIIKLGNYWNKNSFMRRFYLNFVRKLDFLSLIKML